MATDAIPMPLTGVTPYLSIASRGGQAAVEFYARAFGAVEVRRLLAEDGERLIHAHLHINGASVISSRFGPAPLDSASRTSLLVVISSGPPGIASVEL